MLKFFRKSEAKVIDVGDEMAHVDPVVSVSAKLQNDPVKEARQAELDAWEEGLFDAQRAWQEEEDRAIRALPDREPLQIRQREDGWWVVLKRVLRNDSRSPRQLDQIFQQRLMRWSLPALASDLGGVPIPKLEDARVSVSWDYEPYDMTFKTFAEAKDWAADTARLGQHTFYISERGDVQGCSHPDGLAHLELDIQAAETAQERAIERAASYTEDAPF